ncbi:autoinducer binding domain-containing protein [Rhizobium sp. AG855]|uniref:autoinducer binding domain-containing protein n=1 Tax=Rhizobium sp. AG855 TaxID=2183898 RepID=UPI000E725F52|nr:autoinducer binding domain-containing protein [Rhizobium sp. AG855]RKE76941.1 LuxR family transcriptional regulator [Rhizobium sp. AG855]
MFEAVEANDRKAVHPKFSHVTKAISVAKFADFSEIVHVIRNTYSLANVVYHAAFIPGAPAGHHLFHTFEQGGQHHHVWNDFFWIYAIAAALRNAVMPADWADYPLTDEIRAIFADAKTFDVGRQGVSMPLRHPSGSYGVLTLTSNASAREWATEQGRALPEMLFIGDMLHKRYVEIVSLEEKPDFSTPLNSREREALALLASGHEVKQIAALFKCSQTTVRNELRSASLKLH